MLMVQTIYKAGSNVFFFIKKTNFLFQFCDVPQVINVFSQIWQYSKYEGLKS